jgi:probable phosphoglycerate mutase
VTSSSTHGARDDDVLHVLLLRHGQTDSNAGGTIQGHLPIPLNDRGRRQAELLATRIGAWRPRVEAIVSSDLSRATQTAEPIARACALGDRVTFDRAWRERGLGELEGKTVGDREIWRAATGEVTPPGAESVPQFRGRVVDAFRALPTNHAGYKVIAVVTHGGPIRAILRAFATGELPLDGDRAVAGDVAEIANCSVLHLAWSRSPGTWRIECLNDVVHLASLATARDVG